jgi:hypothetical protein
MNIFRVTAGVVSVSAALTLGGHLSVAQTNAPLKIEKITMEDAQIARFSVSGPPYSAFVIEASSDWKTWALLSFTNTTPPPSGGIPEWPPQQVVSLVPIFIMSPEGRRDGIGAPRQGAALFYRLRATNAPPPIVLTNLFPTRP